MGTTLHYSTEWRSDFIGIGHRCSARLYCVEPNPRTQKLLADAGRYPYRDVCALDL